MSVSLAINGTLLPLDIPLFHITNISGSVDVPCRVGAWLLLLLWPTKVCHAQLWNCDKRVSFSISVYRTEPTTGDVAMLTDNDLNTSVTWGSETLAYNPGDETAGLPVILDLSLPRETYLCAVLYTPVVGNAAPAEGTVWFSPSLGANFTEAATYTGATVTSSDFGKSLVPLN